MKKTLVIVAVILIIVGIPVCIIAQFSHLVVWGNTADFKGNETAFFQVKNYVEHNVQQGKILYFDATHSYDLYDFEAKIYLNCPENIKAALKIIANNASRSADVRFNVIKYMDDKIIFGVEAVGYAVVYSPGEVPYDALGDKYPRKTHCKKIQKDWYHTAIY